MRTLVRFTLGQTVALNVIFVILMVVGIWSGLTVPIERYPGVDFGKVLIRAFYPGASPKDVEALVTREIEDALRDLNNVEYIISYSDREFSRILVKFLDDVDYQQGFDDLRMKVLAIQDRLPETVDPPHFDLLQTDDIYPVVVLNLMGERDNRTLTLVGEEIQNVLRQVDGIRDVELQGEFQREYHVLLNPDKLRRFGVTFDAVTTALQAANVNIPAGDLDTDQGEFVLIVDEQFRTREAVEAVVVRTDADGSFLRVGDLIQDAGMSYREPNIITSVNGAECVTLKVVKTPGGNALDILQEIEQTLQDYAPVLEREGIQAVLTQNSTVEIRDSMSTLGWNLIIGIGLLSIMIWWFMGLRNAALTTIGIPFAFLVTMIFLKITGNSLNEITLFSFVLISGIVVDDAIVVIENIYRHFQEGKAPMDAVVDGTAEVFLPILAVTLTTIAAFLPMLLMTGSTGDFFAQIPKAVSFALAASVLECLLILPLHYLDYGPRPKPNQEHKESGFIRKLRAPVEKLVLLTLRLRWLTLGVVAFASFLAFAVAVVSVAGIAPIIRVKFFPDDYSRYFVDVEAKAGTSIEETNELLKVMAAELSSQGTDKIHAVEGYAGYWINEDYQAVFYPHIGQLIVTLPSRENRDFRQFDNDPAKHLEWVRELMQPYGEQGLMVRVRPQQDGPPSGKDVNVRAVGPNDANVIALALEIRRFLSETQGLAEELIDLEDDMGQPNRIFRFNVNLEAAGEYGIPPAQIAAMTASTLNGRIVGKFRDGDEDVDLVLKLPTLATPDEALALPMIEHPSGPVLLGDLNRTSVDEEEGSRHRFQGEFAVAVLANLRQGSSLSAANVVNRVKEHYANVRDQYPGAALNFSGEYEDTRRSFQSLATAFLVAVLAIYLILATQFRSYLQPFIVLSAIPFAFIGVVLGIFLTRSLFTINSMIAMVGVAGVVVNDSLVLIEFINKGYRSGLSRREAILRGTQVRLRPILLTTLTTSLAFLPMALGIPEYSVVWGSMATTFVTGLCTATFLTLFIIPVQWDLVTQFAPAKEGRRR